MKTKEEVLAAATRLEEEGMKFYREIAGKTKNEATKKMFLALADDEVKHIEWIHSLAVDVDTSAEFNKATYNNLKSIFVDAPKEIKEEAKATQTDLQAIDIAIGMEIKSQKAYQEYADESNDPEIKHLFEMLVDIEKFHQQVLENSKEYLNSPADWFMQEEGWMFDGG